MHSGLSPFSSCLTVGFSQQAASVKQTNSATKAAPQRTPSKKFKQKSPNRGAHRDTKGKFGEKRSEDDFHDREVSVRASKAPQAARPTGTAKLRREHWSLRPAPSCTRQSEESNCKFGWVASGDVRKKNHTSAHASAHARNHTHKHIHIHIHIHIHTHHTHTPHRQTHTHTQTHKHINTQTHKHTNTPNTPNRRTRARTHSQNTRMQSHFQAQAHAHAHAHLLACSHPGTHASTRYTRTCKLTRTFTRT